MSGTHFFEKLQKRVETTKSMLCIGLDPHVSQLSEHTADAAAAFCINIIEKTHLYAAAYKPNSAFFEAFGANGFDALVKVMKVLHTRTSTTFIYSAAYIYCSDRLHLFILVCIISRRQFPPIFQLSSTIREEILTPLPRHMRHLHSRFSMQVLLL